MVLLYNNEFLCSHLNNFSHHLLHRTLVLYHFVQQQVLFLDYFMALFYSITYEA